MRRNLNIKFYNRIKGPAQGIEVKKTSYSEIETTDMIACGYIRIEIEQKKDR